MINKETKKSKASVLAVTMIILGLVLSIALSASLVSILGNKASVSSNKSNLAYSRADSGVETLLLRIKNADANDLISTLDSNCDGIVNTISSNFKLELKDAEGKLINSANGHDCSAEKISAIRTIKSTGIVADNNQRSIEVAVAATSGCHYVGATSSSYNGAEVGGYSGGNAKCDPVSSNSHMCAASEFANGLPNEDGWYSSFLTDNSPFLTDCDGWTNGSINYGPVWDSSASRAHTPEICSSKYKILCCTCE